MDVRQSDEENSFEINICQDSEIKSNAEIYMYVNEISQQGITYTMVNHSLYMIRYGLEYDLQRIVDEEWVSELEGLKGSYYFSEEAYHLEPGQEISMTDTFEHPVLSKGQYCLAKSFALVDQNDSAVYSVTLKIEFMIE